MGRLFQYNRFGAVDDHKKDSQATKAVNNDIKVLPSDVKCPAYSAIYTESIGADQISSEFAKCPKWSNKLSSSSSSNASAATSTTTSGYHSQQETLQNAVSRTQKAYISMKDFLRRKLFQQHEHELLQEQDKFRSEEDMTSSDFDEHDVLDTSYHADEEADEDATDCSCSYSSSSDNEQRDSQLFAASPAPTKASTPRKSVLSLNCWQSSNHSDTSSGSEAESESDDADRCQLVSNEKSNRKRRSAASRQPRYNTNNDDGTEEEDLMNHDWYQPMITSKSALAHLQDATPGSFIVRRRNAASFELCLRTERKVKQYIVQSTATSYKLKGAKKEFSTLKAFVTHHSLMAEQLPLTLDMPRVPEKKEVIRYADDFEPLESLQLLGILKSLQAKHFEW